MSKLKKVDVVIVEMLKKVKEMQIGGDLDKLIMEEIGKVEKVLYEEAVNYRDTITANKKADFFPSGVSSL